MKALVHEKQLAIALRKKGLSYREILKEVPVAKSSLSLWLKDIPLTSFEKQHLKKRKDANIASGRIKAGAALRKRRLEREGVWFEEARTMFDVCKHEPLFHAGIALYWAEGAKRVTQWSFSNSDHQMIQTMVCWLERYGNVLPEELFYRLYIHAPYAGENLERWWMRQLSADERQFMRTIYKQSGLGVKKRPGYKGCLKVEVRKSKHLLCKMKFWQNMIVECYRKAL